MTGPTTGNDASGSALELALARDMARETLRGLPIAEYPVVSLRSAYQQGEQMGNINMSSCQLQKDGPWGVTFAPLRQSKASVPGRRASHGRTLSRHATYRSARSSALKERCRTKATRTNHCSGGRWCALRCPRSGTLIGTTQRFKCAIEAILPLILSPLLRPARHQVPALFASRQHQGIVSAEQEDCIDRSWSLPYGRSQ